MHFTSSPSRYRQAQETLSQCFDAGSRLPGSVLRNTPQAQVFFEFDEVFSGEFWEAIQELAFQYGDDELTFAVLHPDPERYFYREFGYFPMAELPVGTSGDQYMDMLSYAPDTSPADSVLHNGQVLVFLSRSGGVAVWADRDLELGLLALFDRGEVRAPVNLPGSIGWFDVQRAAEVIAPSFVGGRVPTDVYAELVAHYG